MNFNEKQTTNISKHSLFLAVCLSVLSCRSSSLAEVKFIGGELASGPAYGALIWLPNCTGVLISPKTIATAAHCVHIFSGANAGQISPKYVDGARIVIGNSQTKDPTSDVAETVTIDKTLIHPSWEETCTKESPCDPNRAAAKKNASVSDIALINLKSPITSIPFARVDFTEVKPQDDVILTGFGCENGINTGQSGRKKTHPIQVSDGEKALDHEGSERKDAIDETLSANFITPGGKESSLCPGDSGGPVFRGLTEEENKGDEAGQEVTVKFIGINADYTFKGNYEQQGAIPETNIHTRIDTPVVKDWILKHAIDLETQTSQDIFLAAEHNKDSLSEDHFKIHVSTFALAETIIFCWKDEKKCDQNSSSEFQFIKKSDQEQRSFFETKNHEILQPKEFTVLALDKEKKILSKSFIQFTN